MNFLAYPVLEVEGKTRKVTTLFLFQRTSCDVRDASAADERP